MLIKQYLIKYIYLFEHKGGENIRKQLIPKKTKTFLSLLLISLGILFCISTVSAASNDVIYVNGTGGNDSWDGQSWTTAKSTIKNATGTLNPNGNIFIAKGTYSGKNNTNITIDKNMTITGQSQTGTIINGTDINWIFKILPGINVNICNLTITNGNGTGSAVIYNNGQLGINNCTFTHNSGVFGGVINSLQKLIMNDCTFTNNQALNGGAIYTPGYVEITNCNFNNNQAHFGGAILVHGLGYLTNCSFNNNQAEYGGAIHIYDYAGICYITNSNFINNTAKTGGAISSDNGLYATSCIFIDNSAINRGGVIHSYGGGWVHFSSFVRNTSHLGQAIDGTINASDNWWGSNNPNFESLLNEVQIGSIDHTYWLFMTINATPNSINNTQKSLITVSFNNHSSDGITYTALDPNNGHIPDGIPVIFVLTNGIYGTLNSATAYTHNGTASVLFKAASVGVQDIKATLDYQNVTTNITIDPASDLYLKITSSNNHPKVGEIFTLTYKLGNKGPDNATKVTMIIPLPDGFIVSNISGDGNWTYNSTTNTVTWTLTNVPKGDPYLYITGKVNKPGTYVFSSSISSDNYNINTEGVTPITINTANEVNATSSTRTIGMQETGLPITALILAILMVIGGLLPKRK